MREILLLLGCATLCACADEPRSEAPTASIGTAGGNSTPVEVDLDPPMAAAGTVVEHPSGLRIEIVTSGTGRAAHAGRTVVFHQRTRVLPATAATQPAETEPAPASADVASTTQPSETAAVAPLAVVETNPVQEVPTTLAAEGASSEAASASGATTELPSAEVAEVEDATSVAGNSVAPDSTPAAATAETQAAAAPPNEAFWISSTWSAGVPWKEVLGRGDMIAGLESALEGARAGCKLLVRIPAALAYGETGSGAIPPNRSLEIEVELVEVR